VHTALTCKIAAARGDEIVSFVVQPCVVTAQPLEHVMLKIEHTISDIPGRDAQPSQDVGMPVEKVGILAQIVSNFARAEFARPGSRRTAARHGPRLVVRMVGHV
jgi:hypothetical protein